MINAVTPNLAYLTEETAAKIELPVQLTNSNDIYVHYEEVVKSNDFSFIHDEDLQTILKTIRCALYILKYTAPLVDKEVKEKMKW